jgi:hypothetical protein
MLKNWTQAVRAFIASLVQRSREYLENERSREIPQAEQNETAMFLFFLVVVWLIAYEFGGR